MDYEFAQRMSVTPRSYIMELISICQDPEIISFASGLPDNDLLPRESIAEATLALLSTEEGRSSLQYSITEGYPPLREFIADRYKRRLNFDVDPEEMIIVNGSQQCFDLMGKVFLDPGSGMSIEQPGYIGAVQSFCVFEPIFRPIDLHEDGPDLEMLQTIIREYCPRLYYAVPNSQNPMGSTYSLESRRAVADIIGCGRTMVLEDDAYGELCFDSEPLPPIASIVPEHAVLTGSFSKVFSPGMRCGWMVGPPKVMEKVRIVKEAADLHSNLLSQRIIHQWLHDNDLDAHIEMLNRNYGAKRDLMVRLIDELMPEGVTHTNPSGGLFVWMTLPEGSTMDLFQRALKKKVAIMPGAPFYTGGGSDRGARLNFSKSSLELIEEGVTRLAEVTRSYLRSL